MGALRKHLMGELRSLDANEADEWLKRFQVFDLTGLKPKKVTANITID